MNNDHPWARILAEQDGTSIIGNIMMNKTLIAKIEELKTVTRFSSHLMVRDAA